MRRMRQKELMMYLEEADSEEDEAEGTDDISGRS